MNGVNVNDGDHDFNGTDGRLLFKVDAASGAGGICIPTKEYQEVNVEFTNIVDWVPPSGPIAPLRVNDTSNLPNEFELLDNYPNPFNPSTSISFNIPNEVYTEVAIYNMMGQKVSTLVNGFQENGSYNIEWNGVDNAGAALASGIYLVKLTTEYGVLTNKVTLLK